MSKHNSPKKINVSIKFSFDQRDISTEKTALVFDCISRLFRAVMTPAELRSLADQLHGKVKRIHATSPAARRISYPRKAEATAR